MGGGEKAISHLTTYSPETVKSEHLGQEFSTGGFIRHGVFGSGWTQFWLSHPGGRSDVDTTGIQRVETRDAAGCPTVHRTVLRQEQSGPECH